MGQGRKKCAKSGAYRYRRRSVALDVEEQEAKTVMSYLGAPSGMRHNSFSYNRTRYTQRESQPSQVMIRPRHDSLVEYMSSSSTPSLPIKKPNLCSQPPLAGDQHVTDSIPFISTAPAVQGGRRPPVEVSLSKQHHLHERKGQGPDQRNAGEHGLHSHRCPQGERTLRGPLSLPPQYASFRHLTVDPKDLVRVVLFNKIDRVFASLIHGCRYEHIYGISSRTALLLVASFSPC